VVERNGDSLDNVKESAIKRKDSKVSPDKEEEKKYHSVVDDKSLEKLEFDDKTLKYIKPSQKK